MLNVHTRHHSLAAAITAQLDQVSLIFERQLASEMSAVNSLCMHVEQYRGKMLRPTLVLLCGLAAGEASKRPNVQTSQGALSVESLCSQHVDGPECVSDAIDANSPAWQLVDRLTEKHRIIAAVVEMIHMATLVHDDVLDESQVRRRGATVNHLWGNETAVILGDYLISNAFHLCSTLGEPAINLALGAVTNTLCEGELVQLHHRNNYSIGRETYMAIVQRKTASLIAECCRLGGYLSGAGDEVCAALARFGSALGIAFQIHDDLLDLVGAPSLLGKPLGQDLEKGKLTLPVIDFLERADARSRGEMLHLIMRGDASALRGPLQESGALDRTIDAARELVAKAKLELPRLPRSEAREVLAALADDVVTRRR